MPLKTAVATLIAGTLLASAAQADGQWRTSRPMDTARSDAAVAVLDNEIYVAGGSSVLGPRDAFEVYDPLGELWRPLPALTEGRERFGMTAMGGELYLSGGYEKDSLEETADLWIYDAKASTWREGPPMPSPRAGHVLVAVEGKLYALGGTGPEADRVMVYAPGDQSWSLAPWSLSEARSGLAAVVDETSIYLIGGVSRMGHSARVERVDVTAGQVERLKDMPRARSGHTAAMIGGKIHVTGGVSREAMKTFSEHDVYDPAARAWRSAPPLPTPRHGLVSAAIQDRWYVIGGGSGAGFFTVFTEADVVEVYEE